MIENIFTLKGTLYAKDTRKVPNKKKPEEPDYEFRSIKVEMKALVNGRSVVSMPEVHLDRNVGFDEFDVGDPISVDCYAIGKEISEKWWKTELRAIRINFTDLDVNGRRPGKEKISVSSTSNADDFPKPKGGSLDDDEYGDLPFIFTIPIALGFLLQFIF